VFASPNNANQDKNGTDGSHKGHSFPQKGHGSEQRKDGV
jgi:hypothetical protein